MRTEAAIRALAVVSVLAAAGCTTYDYGGRGAGSAGYASPAYHYGYADRGHYYRDRYHRYDDREFFRWGPSHRSQWDRYDDDRRRHYRDRDDDRRHVRSRDRNDYDDRRRTHRRHEDDDRDRRHVKRDRRDGDSRFRQPPQDDERGWFGNQVRRRPSQDGA